MKRGIEATPRWNRLIAHEARVRPDAALPLYKSMRGRGAPPNAHTFPAILNACAALRDPLPALQLHAHLSRLGLLLAHPHAAASLLHAYGHSALPRHALILFDDLPHHTRDAFCWTALISSLALNSLTSLALQTFNQMRHCCNVDGVALAAVLLAVDSLLCAQSIHALVLKHGLGSNTRLVSTLLHAYSKPGSVDDTLRVFDGIPMELRDIVSWNTVITGLAMNGRNEQAVCVFDDMTAAGIAPNHVTVLTVLKSCGQLGCIETSRRIHDYIILHHRPAVDDVAVLTGLVDMHARCGALELAREMFGGIKGKNVVCWSAMIAGYEQASQPDEALILFGEMLRTASVRPNAVTMLSVLSACSMIGASRPGGVIHKFVLVTGLNNDVRVTSGLIDMYAKCGDIRLARKVFESTSNVDRTMVSWSAMIGAEGLHGEGMRALGLFSEMQESGVRPNEVTFVSLLSACSHSGLVEEGISCFKGMERDHGVSPNAKHYACMVDLLGRAGRLNEAHEMISNMSIEPDTAMWGSLLAACHIHNNCELGEVVEKRILALDPENVGRHALLANMYGSAGRWKDVIRMRVEVRKKGLVKVAGFSFIEIGNKIYGFRAEDWSNPESKLIYEELQALDCRVRDAGYVKELASPGWVEHMEVIGTHTRSEYHSERLAIAFGIMMNRRGHGAPMEPIRITKNLRVCRDCHVYTKFVSRVIKRELIVRDSHRFHSFCDGECSCGDYW